MTKRFPPIEEIFPDLPPDKREAAQERWRSYLELVLEIQEYVASDPERYRAFQERLTRLKKVRSMQDRSNDC